MSARYPPAAPSGAFGAYDPTGYGGGGHADADERYHEDDETQHHWDDADQPMLPSEHFDHHRAHPATARPGPAPGSPFSDQSAISSLSSPTTAASPHHNNPFFPALPEPPAVQPAAQPAGPAAAFTQFPDTWDPPADHEYRDLPSGLRLKARFGGLLGKKKHHDDDAKHAGDVRRSSTFNGVEQPKDGNVARSFSSFGRNRRSHVG